MRRLLTISGYLIYIYHPLLVSSCIIKDKKEVFLLGADSILMINLLLGALKYAVIGFVAYFIVKAAVKQALKETNKEKTDKK